MKKFWNSISDTGIGQDLPYSEQGRIRITNQMVIIVSLCALFYFLYEIISLPARKSPDEVFWFYTFHLGITIFFIPILLLNKIRWYLTARLVMTSLATVLITMNSLSLSQPFRTELYLFVVAAFVFIVFRDLKIIVPIFVLQAAAYYWTAGNIIEKHPEIAMVNAGLIFRIVIPFSILFFILFFLKQENSKSRREIEVKNNQLSADRDEMAKLNFTKDKIFSIISHDLRSPIGSLQALLELLQGGRLSIEEFKSATASLEKQVKQLSTSLDELLTWSKAQLHGINPVPEMINLRQLIYEVVSVNRITARNKGIIVTTNIPADVEVYCDPNMLKSIITNLTTNAIKFTPVGGAVSIFCNRVDNMVDIHVEDTGVGIPGENIKKIFTPSIHFSTRGTSNEKGTGLGLAMCQEFVLKNNGTFDVKSEDGKGSRFTIRLPFSKLL